jgi:uncharacterized membrane protein YgaE (UPF0421/DUF939 family)
MAKKQLKMIDDIYRNYFQKSKVFLYPRLNIISKNEIKPINTFLSWENKIDIEENKLICLFKDDNSKDFKKFEDEFLYSHQLFSDYIKIDKSNVIYTFDYSIKYKQDFENVIKSKFSKLSKDAKEAIKKYYGINSANYAFLDTFLYPENYYTLYANLLCTNKTDIPQMITLLKQVNELCSLTDLEKETFKIEKIEK